MLLALDEFFSGFVPRIFLQKAYLCFNLRSIEMIELGYAM
jgi:hypothetical protein